MGLRIGFHYHIPAEERDGRIWMPSYLCRFIDGLALQCDEVVCFMHSPQQSQKSLLDDFIKNSNVTLVNLGPHCAVWKRTFFSGIYVKPIFKWRNRLDVMMMRGPSPLLPAFTAAAQKNNIPTTLLLVGSYVDGVDDLPQPRWRKELIRIYCHYNQWQQNRCAIRSLTFVNSRKLFDYYQVRASNLVETRTTTLSELDFFVREDTCSSKPVRLLYTGRFDRAKGLLEIVQALAHLVASGQDLQFDLVGWDDSGTGVEQEIQQLAEKLGVSDRVMNHGRKTVGPELFTYYQQADIYVIASKGSEGFPRTIWEAMAHSLPVIATRVGSIPQFIEGAATIIEPASVEAIVSGIDSIICSPSRRREMIRSGLELARENTLERRSREMIDKMNSWLKEKMS